MLRLGSVDGGWMRDMEHWQNEDNRCRCILKYRHSLTCGWVRLQRSVLKSVSCYNQLYTCWWHWGSMFCRCTCCFFLVPVSCQQPSLRQECLHCCCLHLFVNEHVTVNSTVNNCHHSSKALNVWVPRPKTSQCLVSHVETGWCWTLWFVQVPFPQWRYSPFCTAPVPWDPYLSAPECCILTVPGNSLSPDQCAVPVPVLTVLLITEFAVSSNPSSCGQSGGMSCFDMPFMLEVVTSCQEVPVFLTAF